MRRSRGFVHPVARRVALASMTVLATSGIGMIAGPAVGQIIIPIGGPIGGTSQGAQVTNAGSASANTGGNTAVGNNSTNSASTTSTGGDLLNVPVSLGAPTNTSTDSSAAVTTGPATAAGNSSDTSVGQSNASGNTVNSFLATQSQGAGVTNAGSASANTGGNTAIGNNSQNNATATQQVSGGLLGVGVTLGGPTNNSTGTATINSGAANATGNSAGTNVGQSAQGGAGGGPGGFIGGPGGGGLIGGGGAVLGAGGPCGNRFASFQNVNVSNRGEATANTGNNEAVGNASTNDASVSSTGQTVSGGLLGVGVTIGGPVNNSSGTAVINTGPANAVGNDSTTSVGQSQTCPQPMVAAQGGRHPVVVPKGHVAAKHHAVQHPRTLARTGLDSADLGMIGGALLGAGMLLVASQRRRLAARHAAVPMAGFGMGMGADDWDRPVR
jgi:hypothetical protein